MHKSAQFRQMIDGTREEYALIAHYEDEYAKQLPDRVLEALAKLEGGLGMGGYAITRYQHSLQSATRALSDGADIE